MKGIVREWILVILAISMLMLVVTAWAFMAIVFPAFSLCPPSLGYFAALIRDSDARINPPNSIP